MDERIDEVVQEIEDEQRLGRVSAVKVFRSMLNQPNLVALSSADGIQEGESGTPLSQASFYNFTCNLPRPCLDVASIQLLGANIPQAQSNIPNTACMFWYYRLSAYSGQIPTLNNLYYNRLLPSTYKQEFVQNPNQYGWNRTFKNYRDLETELVKMGVEDLTFNNEQEVSGEQPPHQRVYVVPYIPGDITISLNPEINKFEMKGNNVGTPPTFMEWFPGSTYAIGDQVFADFGDQGAVVSWVSLANSNIGYDPQDNPTFWRQDYNTVMALWDADTNYGLGRYVTDGLNIFVSTYPNATQNPSSAYTWSSTQTYSQFQVSVSPLNGLQYTYVSQIPRRNHRPDLYPGEWILTAYNSLQLYPEGFIAEYLGIYYVALTTSTGRQPNNNPGDWKQIAFWTQVDTAETLVWNRYFVTGYQDPNVAVAQGEEVYAKWTPYSLYELGFIVDYQGNTPLIARWNSSTTYAIGDYVRYDNGEGTEATWRCEIAGTVGISPGNVNNWVLLSYEAETQNIGTPPLPLWDATTTYPIGSQVLFGISYYQSVLSIPDNINKDPIAFPNYWTPIRTEWRTTTTSPQTYGFANMSNDTDFLQGDAGQSPINFPEGFNQPFAPNPKRLLNSILGFTWNGVFSVSSLMNFSINPYNTDFFLTKTPITRLLNRLRPVPIYDLLEEWDNYVTYSTGELVQFNGNVYRSLQDDNTGNNPIVFTLFWELDNPLNFSTAEQVGNIANLADVFTADAYACLVYSSIIYIYTSIAGASSLDTSRNTNLLAITPMNAGNLGVAFSNQMIDNPLNKIAGDIYNIYIEMRDEFGEPYLLSNNAVATFMLKVRYLEENLPRQNT